MKYLRNTMLIVAMSLLSMRCTGDETVEMPFQSAVIKITDASLNKFACYPGDVLDCTVNFVNSSNYPVEIESISAIVNTLGSDAHNVSEDGIGGKISLAPGESVPMAFPNVFAVPDDYSASTLCSLSFRLDFGEGVTSVTDGILFRVINDEVLLTYEVERTEYKGVPVFRQFGDMSAAYGVVKSLAAFSGGMAPTMHQTKSGGPDPVVATPEFLLNSIIKTVGLYNNELGANAKIRRVVIGPGIASASYLAGYSGAAFLPIHYLVSANSVGEIEQILDYSNNAGIACYSTMGYDGSVPGVGVAWIKLLDLPQEYIDFINDHQVEEIYLYGMSQSGLGESCARQVMRSVNTGDEYAPGSLYMLYTNNGTDADINALKNRYYDYTTTPLGAVQYISDWESGLCDRQIENMAKTTKETTAARIFSITSDDMMRLYNMAPALYLTYTRKNASLLNHSGVTGMIFNEYLTNHPVYEAYKGYVPMLYWQMNPASATLGRIDSEIKPLVNSVYPGTGDRIKDGYYYLNSNLRRNELRNGLINMGVAQAKIKVRRAADLWNPDDDTSGMVGSTEDFVYDIIDNIGVDKYRDAVKNLRPLTFSDIRSSANKVGGVNVSEH